LIKFLKRLQVFKQEWQESPSGNRQTDGKNLVWFGELERKLAKSSKTTFTYRSSSFLFYAGTCPCPDAWGSKPWDEHHS
jgi:hypothetical protein